jgi:hypothetical protein
MTQRPGIATARCRRREPMDEPTKKGWSRPEVIELVRGGSQEAVLITCKANMTAGDPSSVNHGCAQPVIFVGCTGSCNSEVTS